MSAFDQVAALLGATVLGVSLIVVLGAIVLHERQRQSDLTRLLSGFGILLIEWGERARHRPQD